MSAKLAARRSEEVSSGLSGHFRGRNQAFMVVLTDHSPIMIARLWEGAVPIP